MIFEIITEFFKGIRNAVPVNYQILFDLFIYTFFVVIYSIFIWKFYKFLSNREILKLNLRQYNNSQHPALEKFFATILFTIEYIIILPFLVLFWFTILSLFLLLLSVDQSAQQILLISAVIIASTRITAYINEGLSKDFAKIFPFTVLAIFILKLDFFNLDTMFTNISQIPGLFNEIIIFIIFLFAVEFILRFFYSIKELMGSEDEAKEFVAETRSFKRKGKEL